MMNSTRGIADSRKAVIIFYTTNYAMWALDTLTSQEIEATLIPVPRHLSSDCGYCVQISTGNADRAKILLTGEGIEYDRIEILEE